MMVIIKDANGLYVPVDTDSLWEAVKTNLASIYGMSLNSIIEIRRLISEFNYNPSREEDVKQFIKEVLARQL